MIYKLLITITIFFLSVCMTSCITMDDCGRTTRLAQPGQYKEGAAYSTYNRHYIRPSLNEKVASHKSKLIKKDK